MRIAAIDLGSNSFHMLVVQLLGPSSFEVVLREKMMIQLGRTALGSGRLDDRTLESGLRCLDKFRRLALARRVERTIAVATSAIREAGNGEEFLRRAREETGIAVRVISGKEEARLIHLAVRRHVDLQSDRSLLVDIGGGSVELTVGDGDGLRYTTSLKLGFLRLNGKFVSSDPIAARESRAVSDFIDAALKAPMKNILELSPRRVVGTSGSITTLLRLAQRRRPADEPLTDLVTRKELRGILKEIQRLPSVDRGRKFDLDPLRAEYLPTALICLDRILGASGMKGLTVCPVALREGVIYDFMAKTRPPVAKRPPDGDLRLQAVLDLASRCDYPAEHSHQVARLAVGIFRQTRDLHGLGDEEERLLEYGAILHDIGYHIGYAKHHKHAYYLVTNCDLRGFSPAEKSLLANLVRYHRRAKPRKSHAPFTALEERSQQVVKLLTAILRIADGLDRSHFSNIAEVKCSVRKKKVRFALSAVSRDSDLAIDLWAGRRHARYFEKLFGVETEFTAKTARRRSASPAAVAGSGAP